MTHRGPFQPWPFCDSVTRHFSVQNSVTSSRVPAEESLADVLLPEPEVSVVHDSLMSGQNHARENASN